MLNYKWTDRQKKHTLIFLHGMLGSHWHFTGMADHVPFQSHFNVLLVDLRNHGASFHSEDNTIASHANDILNIIKHENIQHPHLIGHSFGAKVSLQLSLQEPKLIQSLAMLDMSPYPLPDHVTKWVFSMVNGLNAINLNADLSTIEAEALKLAGGNKEYLEFLLSNLIKDPSGHYKWKVNMQAIANSSENFQNHVFPNNKFGGPFVEIAGAKSLFVNQTDFSGFSNYLSHVDPKTDIHFLDCGHAVHFEKLNETQALLQHFYEKQGLL